MLLRIAFRNIFRHRRRTLLTALTMFGGFVLCSFSIAWMDGSYSKVIELFTRNRLGHIQIHHQEYLDRPSLHRNITRVDAVGRAVDGVAGVQGWAPRVYSAGLASVGEKTAGVQIIGIDPDRERATTRFDRKVSEGRELGVGASYEAILGRGLARRLSADLGDHLVIVSQGADGSIANERYTVVGIVESGDEMSDQIALYLHVRDAQELLVLDGRVHEIVIVTENIRGLYRRANAIADAIARPDLAVEPWQVFARSFYDAMRADQKGNWVSLVVITLLVATGVLNTVLMNVLERTREYGLMRALGTSPRWVFELVIVEVLLLATLSVIAGIIVSLAVNYAFSEVGIPMPVSIEYGGVTFSEMNTEINVRSYTIPLICVVASAMTICIFPALKAARTRPALAMRAH